MTLMMRMTLMLDEDVPDSYDLADAQVEHGLFAVTVGSSDYFLLSIRHARNPAAFVAGPKP